MESVGGFTLSSDKVTYWAYVAGGRIVTGYALLERQYRRTGETVHMTAQMTPRETYSLWLAIYKAKPWQIATVLLFVLLCLVALVWILDHERLVRQSEHEKESLAAELAAERKQSFEERKREIELDRLKRLIEAEEYRERMGAIPIRIEKTKDSTSND